LSNRDKFNRFDLSSHHAGSTAESSKMSRPTHTGPPLSTGEPALLRRPGAWYDIKVTVRGIDHDLAAIIIIDQFDVVPLAWLRRESH
jgi:hypothetical protein